MKKLHFLPITTALFAVACIHTVSRYNVRASDRLMIPYQTGDTVYCIDAKGNRVMLTVTDETSWWDHYDEYIWEEYRTVHLKSEDSAYKLNICVQGWNYGNYSHRHLSVVFDSPFGFSGGGALYDRGGYFKSLTGGNASDTYTRWDVADSLSIGNRTYYDVALYYHSQSNSSWHCCYNKTYGVLQMMLDEKPVFTLDTVIFAGAR